MLARTSHRLSVNSWPALTLLKCAAVLGMILFHLIFYVSASFGLNTAERTQIVYSVVGYILPLGVFPLMIPFTAGCGLGAIAPRNRTMQRTTQRTQTLISSGLTLLLLGFGVTVLAEGTRAFTAWNVLHMLGVSLIVIAALERCGGRYAVAIFGMVVLMLTPLIRDGLLIPELGENPSVESQFAFLEGVGAPIASADRRLLRTLCHGRIKFVPDKDSGRRPWRHACLAILSLVFDGERRVCDRHDASQGAHIF